MKRFVYYIGPKGTFLCFSKGIIFQVISLTIFDGKVFFKLKPIT